MASGVSVYTLAFVLEADILTTRCNEDDYDATRATFRDTSDNWQLCLSLFSYLVNYF